MRVPIGQSGFSFTHSIAARGSKVRFTLSIFVALTINSAMTWAQPPTALPQNTVADDVRLGPKKTLNGHFPFKVPENPAQWYGRAEQLRRRVLVATGLWPMPDKSPLEAVVFDKNEAQRFYG